MIVIGVAIETMKTLEAQVLQKNIKALVVDNNNLWAFMNIILMGLPGAGKKGLRRVKLLRNSQYHIFLVTCSEKRLKMKQI